MIRKLNYLFCLVVAAMAITGCKKNDVVLADPPSTIIGKWQFVATEGGQQSMLKSLVVTPVYLMFNADSTYKQLSGTSTTCAGTFRTQVIISVIDRSQQPSVSFSTANSFNYDTWNKVNTITIKDDTLRLRSNGLPPYGIIPLTQVFKLSN